MRSLEETQRFRDNHWIFAAMAITIGAPLIVVTVQLVKMPAIDTGSWIGILFTIAILAGTGFFLMQMKTYLKIEPGKIAFRSNPFSGRLKHIHQSEVEQWYIAHHKWVHGLGYKVTLNGGRAYVMRPGKVLVVKTLDGREYRFGINRPTLVKRFLEHNWEEGNKMKYGQ